MTPTETAAKLQHFNDWRRGHHDDTAQPDPREIGEAIDAAVEMIDRLEAAERERDAAELMSLALRTKIEQMEQQAPAYWGPKHAIEGGSTTVIVSKFPVNPTDAPLYALPGAHPKLESSVPDGWKLVPKAVAYLDLGTGGYMDIGTDLTDEALAAIPKGRHMLGIVGTYGVDGYVPAQPAPSVPDTYAAGINAVAAMLQSKADEYAKEHGHDDMGGLSFGPGMGGEIKMDYYTNLIELVDDVRAMLADAPEAKP